MLLYRIFLLLYRAGISVSSIWNEKARQWLQGRRGQWRRLAAEMPAPAAGQHRFWMHCASLGEFEQGRPVLEELRKRDARCVIVVTFFSPSGYTVRRHYPGADVVCYLPMDGPRNARRFFDIVQPTQALFVKYEFWHFYLQILSRRGIPAMLVSGAFRSEQVFFKPWASFFRKMLRFFSVITVQDETSQNLLKGIGVESVLTGDTRYDRVLEIEREAKRFEQLEQFKGDTRLVVAGSTWPEDERMLHACLGALPAGWKLVLAPHEIDAAHLSAIRTLFGSDCVFYSENKKGSDAKVLVIDNIGMLSSLYRYGEIAWIGGGFSRSGIHNVLEPAVFGLPVIMGPEYEKFSEAVELVRKGFAFPVADAPGAEHILQSFIVDDEGRKPLQARVRAHIQSRAGATSKILALLSVASR